MSTNETPLFKAFTWRDPRARDVADSMGNLSVCPKNVAFVIAAAGRLNGMQGFLETAATITSRAARVRRMLDASAPAPRPR